MPLTLQTVVTSAAVPLESGLPSQFEATTAKAARWFVLPGMPTAPDPGRATEDMRLSSQLQQRLAPLLQRYGLALSEAVSRDRYGKTARRFTLAGKPGWTLVLVQLPDWMLRDGTMFIHVDQLRYAFMGKTVRVVAPELDAPSATFNTLQRDWSEKGIDLEFVPWTHLDELFEGRQDLPEVLRIPDPGTVPDGVATTGAAPQPPPVRVFVSYAHEDADYVSEKGGMSLLAYVREPLVRDGFEFWTDHNIRTGDLWDEEIRQNIIKADIALFIVSQCFLNSKYCTDTEVESFLAKRKDSGLVIFPIIISSCDWENHAWLKATQSMPPEGRTIESDFTTRGSRDQLYLSILKQLRERGREVRQRRGN